MGTVASVHFLFSTAPQFADQQFPGSGQVDRCGGEPRALGAVGAAELAITGFFDQLSADETVFSAFRADSVIRRLAAGALTWAKAPAEVEVVAQACRAAQVATEGRFDAWNRGWFDPTGYVKGWSTERAFAAHLAPLLAGSGVARASRQVATESAPGIGLAVGVSVGGDLRVATADSRTEPWHLGISDPNHPGRVLGRVALREGALATSGPAERGGHIVDPATGCPVPPLTATVVAPSLEVADLWATAAVVAGFHDLTWIAQAPVTSGLLVAPDGRIRRFAAGVELAYTG